MSDIRDAVIAASHPGVLGPYTGKRWFFILCAMLTSPGLLVQKTKKASAKISVTGKT